MEKISKNKQITILLSTFNGEKYLKEQLDSIFEQSYKDFEVIARDDGSSDRTKEILDTYDIKVVESDLNLGAKKSFGSLLEYALNNTYSEYFMFCDQDDIWEKDKIEKAINKIKKIQDNDPELPILLHTDLKVVDEELNLLNSSFWNYENIDPRINEFSKLLMFNTITGCTMIINRKLAKLALPVAENSIMHDWWIGLVASKFGKIIFLEDSTIKYRQHSKNDIGAKERSYLNILEKIFSLLFNDKNYMKHLKDNILQAKEFLNRYEKDLDPFTKEMLESFTSIEGRSFIERRMILIKYKLLKQTLIRNIGLLVKI